METTERNFFKELRSIFDQTSDRMTERDAMFLYKSMNAVTCVILDAEQPINSTHTFHAKAERIIEHVQDFVTFRENENWREHSAYLYGFSESVVSKAIAN